MSKRKIKKKTKNRRPRGGDARRADAQNRAAAVAFQRWARSKPDTDPSAAEEVENANQRAAEEGAEQGETIDEMGE